MSYQKNNNNYYRWYNDVNYLIYKKKKCPYFHKSILQNIYYHNCDLYSRLIKQTLIFWSQFSQIKYISKDNNINKTELIFLTDNLKSNTLATCQNYYTYSNKIIINSKITTNINKCFHQNIKTCQIINKYLYFLKDNFNLSIIIITIILSILFLISILFDKYICKNHLYLTTQLFSLFYITTLYIYIFNIRSCYKCFGFTKIMIHELGHSLGLNHSNTSEHSIMSPVYDISNSDCIYYQDFKLLNQVYNSEYTKNECLLQNDLDYFFIQDWLTIPLIMILSCFTFKYIQLILRRNLIPKRAKISDNTKDTNLN